MDKQKILNKIKDMAVITKNNEWYVNTESIVIFAGEIINEQNLENQQKQYDTLSKFETLWDKSMRNKGIDLDDEFTAFRLLLREGIRNGKK